MKPITYEIKQWVEIRFQPARYGHLDRWYIWNDLTECEYVGESGQWQRSDPKFFDKPYKALRFWNKTLAVRS